MLLLCVCMLVCFPTDSLARHSGGGWYRSRCHQNQSPVEQRGDGIPTQAAINPTWRGYSHLLWPLFHFRDNARKGCHFFFFFPFNMHRYCKSTRHRSGKYQRQIKKKGTGKFFSLPPPLHPYPSLFYLSVAESQWFIIIGRCHHADDTQSPRSEYH